MAINVGSVYFIGYFGNGTASAGNPSREGFLILVRQPLAAGEVLSFTDNALQANGTFATNEQSIQFTVPAGGIAANSVLQFPLNGSNTTTVYLNTGDRRSPIGTITPTGATGLNNAGDQLFAYQGSLAEPTVLAGVDVANNSPITSGATNSMNTYAPTNGAPFLDFPTGTGNIQFAANPKTASDAQLRDTNSYTQNIPTSNNPEDSFSSVACYCTGTLIRTVRDGTETEVTVETLAIGDLVVTASGAHRPIKWIGHRAYSARFAGNNPDLLPIHFAAGSLADNVPARDLQVSPKHAMFLDGVLVPAEHLVNGVTIVNLERAIEVVEYWHVELDSHDVLLAEGAPSESFVDDHSRSMFHNAHTFRESYPDLGDIEAVYCAPRVDHGYALDRIRRRLGSRAGLTMPFARDYGVLRGRLDLCDGSLVQGWAQNGAFPDAPVCLDVVVDGMVVARAYAELFRLDLRLAGVGDGCHAFSLRLQEPLSPDRAHDIELRRSADGTVLSGATRLPASVGASIAA